jgi:CarboxypepD_reg-like domain
MRTFVFFIILNAIAAGLIAQTGTRRITGGIYDKDSQEPIQLAFIFASNHTDFRTSTDSLGRFSFLIPENEDTLIIRCTGYFTIRLKAPQSNVFAQIFMESSVLLPPVEINAGTRRVLEDDQTYVHDFAFLGENIIILFNSPELKRNVLQLIAPWGKILSEQMLLPENPASIFTDCEGNVYALCEETAYKLLKKGTRSMEYQPINITEFKTIVEPCTGELQGSYFFRVPMDAQHLGYMLVTQDNPRPRPLVMIADSFILAMIKDDSLMEAKGLGMTPSDPQRAAFAAGLDARFRTHVLLAPVNAPMVVADNTAIIFDHENGNLLRFDAAGKPISSTPIKYQKDRHWAKQTIPNHEGTRVYTTFEHSGYFTLAEVDLQTGEITPKTELEHPFVTKVTIKNGWVYYLYRDNIYDPIRRLYRTPLTN